MNKVNFQIIKATTCRAPSSVHGKNNSSKWRDLFEAMSVGDWFLVENQYAGRAAAAGTTYLKRRYRLYMHPVRDDVKVFVKIK